VTPALLRVLPTLPLLVPALAPAFAPGTPVYRCGDSYSAQRCGEAPALDVADPRSAAERTQAADVARRERRLADTLAAQRRAREAPPPAVKAARAARPCSSEPPAKVVRTGLVAPQPAASAASCGRKAAKKRAAKTKDAAASAPFVIHLPAR